MYWILLLGLALAWITQALLIRKNWKRGLGVSLRFLDHYIYEGDSSVLQEVVTNDKLLPLPALEVRIALSSCLAFTGEAADNSKVSDKTYKRDVFSFLFHQQVTRSLTFTARKRGCYELHEADLKAYDFFFHELDYAPVPQDTMLYVYPAPVDTRRLDILCTAITGTILVQNQLFPDPFEFAGIREYQPTDPMNRMNWKASLRMGAPMVNQFDSTTNMDLTLVFDVEDSQILKSDSLVEETIRIAASLAARLVAARMPVEVYSNATDFFSMSLPANASHMAKLNQRLACISSADMTCQELLAKVELHRGSDQVLVLISKNTDEKILSAVRQLATTCPILWVIPKYSYQEPELPDIAGVRTFLWEVS
jgi:uncharacterized protein (DUF58 family)